MDDKRRKLVQAGILGAGAIAFSGCEALEVGASVAMQAGGLSSEQADSVIRGTRAAVKAYEDFTPEQEYYIGRSVSAHIFQKYRPFYDVKKQTYLTQVGLSLALNSDMPETFGGYHFAMLDSDEINAFAAPGGFVFVTKGMLRCCAHEDALAAVLAHEISHSQLKHGLQAIKDSRAKEAVALLGTAAASVAVGGDLGKLVENITGTILDISTTMMANGYSREYEREADARALVILDKAGYSPKGMGDMLALMGKRIKPGGTDFFKTHPSPKERLELISSKLESAPQVPANRQQRLTAQLGQV